MSRKIKKMYLFLIMLGIIYYPVNVFSEMSKPQSKVGTHLTPKFESTKTPEVVRDPVFTGESLLNISPLNSKTTSPANIISTQSLLSQVNLIPNSGLESTGSDGLPVSWHKGGYGVNSRTFHYPVLGSNGSGIEVGISSYNSGDAKWYFDYVNVEPGQTYIFSDKYKSTIDSVVTVDYKMLDGSHKYVDIAVLPASTVFSTANVNFVVPNNVVSLTIFHLIKNSGTLVTDNYELYKIDSVSNTSNYVSNPGFEYGVTTPDNWKKGKWGNNSVNFIYPVSNSTNGKAAGVTITDRVSGDAKWYFDPINLSPGSYLYYDDYKSTVPTYVTVQYKNTDGSVTYKDIGYLTASPDWNSVSLAFDVTSNVVGVTVFHLINTNGSLYVDNVGIKKDESPKGVFATGAVSLRFDDNWLSQYQNAFPVLDSVGLKGTLYVVSNQTYDDGFVGYMSHNQIMEVSSHGHEIGAHTRTHRDLSTLSYSDQQYEINGSRQDILSWGISPVISFSYPFGSYNSDSIQIVKDSGFDNAATSNGGFVTPSSDRYQLERKGLEKDTTIDEIKSWIDDAVQNKEWLIITTHDIQDACTDKYCVNKTVFNQMVDYLVSSKIKVVTVSGGLSSIK